jgi:hypothetical protein
VCGRTFLKSRRGKNESRCRKEVFTGSCCGEMLAVYCNQDAQYVACGPSELAQNQLQPAPFSLSLSLFTVHSDHHQQQQQHDVMSGEQCKESRTSICTLDGEHIQESK